MPLIQCDLSLFQAFSKESGVLLLASEVLREGRSNLVQRGHAIVRGNHVQRGNPRDHSDHRAAQGPRGAQARSNAREPVFAEVARHWIWQAHGSRHALM